MNRPMAPRLAVLFATLFTFFSNNVAFGQGEGGTTFLNPPRLADEPPSIDPSPIAAMTVMTPDINLRTLQVKLGMSSGSAFAVSTPLDTYWVTAGHVVSRAYMTGGFGFLTPIREGLPNAIDGDELKNFLFKKSILFKAGDVEFDKDFPYVPRMRNTSRGDFAIIRGPKPQKAYPLRNLLTHPLAPGEKVKAVGTQHFQLVQLDCKFIGIQAYRSSVEGQAYFMLFDCPDAPIVRSEDPDQDGELGVGGISGGAVIDSFGSAVASFNGYLTLLKAPGRPAKVHLIHATALFLGVDYSLQVKPVLPDGTPAVPPMNCVNLKVIQSSVALKEPEKVTAPCSSLL